MALIQRAPEKLKNLDAEQKKLVTAAAAQQELKPDQLIDFEIYWDHVAIIVPAGKKFTYNYGVLVEWIKARFDDEPKAAAAAKPKRTTTRK